MSAALLTNQLKSVNNGDSTHKKMLIAETEIKAPTSGS